MFLYVAVLQTQTMARAFDYAQMPSPCLKKGSQTLAMSPSEQRVDGADTGAFLREVVKKENLSAVQSCVLIPSSPRSSQLEEMFQLNPLTLKPDQSPYLYLGVSIDKKMYEAGLYYEGFHAEGQRPGYRLFTSGFFNKRITYYRKYTFEPGDKICLKLERHPHSGRLDFKVIAPQSIRSGTPLKNSVVITEYLAPSEPKKVEFKRVTGMAVRSLQYGDSYGMNGGMSDERYKIMVSQKIYSTFIWTDLRYFTSQGEKLATLEDLSFDPGESPLCQKSTIWPRKGFTIKPRGKNGSMFVEVVPQNRSAYSSLDSDEVKQFLKVSPVTLPNTSTALPQSTGAPQPTPILSSQASAVRTSTVAVSESKPYSPSFNDQEIVSYERASSSSKTNSRPDTDSETDPETEQCCDGSSCRTVEKTTNIWRWILPAKFYQRVCYNFF